MTDASTSAPRPGHRFRPQFPPPKRRGAVASDLHPPLHGGQGAAPRRGAGPRGAAVHTGPGRGPAGAAGGARQRRAAAHRPDPGGPGGAHPGPAAQRDCHLAGRIHRAPRRHHARSVGPGPHSPCRGRAGVRAAPDRARRRAGVADGRPLGPGADRRDPLSDPTASDSAARSARHADARHPQGLPTAPALPTQAARQPALAPPRRSC